jgi:hypothetical protein
VTAFISQVQRDHIGITAFGLFPVNRPTYLTVSSSFFLKLFHRQLLKGNVSLSASRSSAL